MTTLLGNINFFTLKGFVCLIAIAVNASLIYVLVRSIINAVTTVYKQRKHNNVPTTKAIKAMLGRSASYSIHR